MNKKYLICLECGTVQIRTDIKNNIGSNYIVLKKKYNCPRCEANTKQAATNNIKILKKSLVESNKSLDMQIYSLIER